MLELFGARRRDSERQHRHPLIVCVVPPRSTLRPLGDAAVVFDPLTWQTHLLQPELALVASFASEFEAKNALSASRLRQMLADESGERAEDFDALVSVLAEIGLVDT